MSHQNSLYYKLGELFHSIKENGLLRTVDKLTQRVYYKYKGIDFSTQNLHELTLTGDYQSHGTALVSTSKDFFKHVFDDLEEIIGVKTQKDLLIDYGSGKGAAIIHAKRYGFKKTVGIEFAKELHLVAQQNIQKFNLKNVNSYYQDATTYIPPKDTSVIYLFNPFDSVVMEKVIQNILDQKKNFEHEVYIIYGNPSCEDLMLKYFSLLGKKVHASEARVNYYKLK